MNITLRQKGKSFYVRCTVDGARKDLPAGKDAKLARARLVRFEETESKKGIAAAVAELKGEEYRDPSASPDFERMKELYEDYCQKLKADAPREVTRKHNLARLRVIMERGGFATVDEIEHNRIKETWAAGDLSEPQRRSLRSAVRAASSIWSANALAFYSSAHKLELKNPFKGFKLNVTKKAAYKVKGDAFCAMIFADSLAELPPAESLVIHLALGAGLRRAEIEAMRPRWLTKQERYATLTIQPENGFQPKAGHESAVRIPLDLYETLLDLRNKTGETKSPFFVPFTPKAREGSEPNLGTGRIWELVRKVNTWLKTKGAFGTKPLHDLRREYGSRVYSEQGLIEAANSLRNTVAVCAEFYAGTGNDYVVDMRKKKDPLQDLADEYGVTVEKLRAHLEKLRKPRSRPKAKSAA